MTTVVFPGQGSQYTGMSKDFYDNFNIARVTFQEIEEFTEMNLRKIIFDNNDKELDITKYTQISIFASSVIIFKTIQKELDLKSSSIDVMMGHSLGEYSALACSDKLSLKDACLVLKKRGQLMNDAVPQNKSGMAALIGKDSNYVQKIIKDNNINLEVANDNSPKQVVISGDISEIENNKELFLKNNIIKYVTLNVSAAFHSKLMLKAQEELSEIINQVNFNSNKINIISNYNAEVSNDSLSIKKSLQQQMANKVNWTNSVKKLSEIGQKNIIEIGPGKVLSGLIKRISNNFDIKSINKISDI